MTIYLFGDSYVEAENAESLNVKDHKRWYDILSEMMNEKNENLGRCGEGPIETLKKFQTRFESGWFEKEDKFVIVLSSPYRIPWKWIIQNKTIDAGTMFQEYYSWVLGSTEETRFTEEQKYALDNFYKCMYDELSYTNIKNICLLKHLSAQNNWKMIVFTVFDINRDNPKKNKYNQNAYDLEYLNDDLFYFYPTPLYTHSMNEWVNVGDLNEGMLNHFHLMLDNF